VAVKCDCGGQNCLKKHPNERTMLQQTAKIGPGDFPGAYLLACCAPGSSDYQPFGDILGEKCGPKGRFWYPLKIEKVSKSDLLPLDWHFGPRKMLSGEGSGKVSKHGRIFDRKSEVLEG